jgi:hypothetical protein
VINGLNTKDKLKLIGLCQKIVPLGAVELADDLERVIDRDIAKKERAKAEMNYEMKLCKTCEIKDECKQITLIEPLKAPDCPHKIEISVFAWRQCLSSRYLAHLGSY